MDASDNMKKFIYNMQKYWNYSVYAAKAELKAEVANSYLNWLWWILDPIAFMITYTVMVEVVFGTSEPYFPVFVFIGLTCWNYFNTCISGSVKLVSANKAIVTKVYVPKYILLLVKSLKNLFKMMISWALVIVLMLFFKVPFHWTILYWFLIIPVLFVVTFGISTILLHFGIFVEDLFNVTNIVLKLVFYLSGVFYSIGKRIKGPVKVLLLKCNPIAFLMDQSRNILLYGKAPSFRWLILWFIVGCLLSWIGVTVIHKYENSYAKVI